MAVPFVFDSRDFARNRGEFFRRRYVWQFPVRLAHWLTVVSLCVMFVTGLYIATPQLAPSGEAFRHFVMGRMRQLHFIFAYLFLLAFLIRIYWFWMGNNYARSGFPMLWSREWWGDLRRQALDYLRLKRGHAHLGHNALAGIVYTVFVIALGWAQILTGFALYAENNPGGFWSRLTGWVIPLLGGSMQTRTWHHLFSWGFLVFAIIHVYILIYDGQQYENGLISSMMSGHKFYREGDLDHDTWIS